MVPHNSRVLVQHGLVRQLPSHKQPGLGWATYRSSLAHTARRLVACASSPLGCSTCGAGTTVDRRKAGVEQACEQLHWTALCR